MDTPHVALAEQRNPGTIERVEQDDGTVRYRNVMLLAPGVWGDAASQRQFLYSDATTRTLADNIAETTLNLFHEQDNQTTEVGELDESSVYVGEDDDALYGDLVLSMDNAASEFADEALQDALRSDGEKGIKGPSLEIAQPEHEFNAGAGVPEVTDGVITGVGLVGLGVSLGPGSKDVAFEKQTQQRAVALASADAPSVLTKQHDMSETEQLLGELAEQLSDEDLRAVAEEHGIDLQEDDEDEDPPEGEEMDDESEDEEDDESEMAEDEAEEEAEDDDEPELSLEDVAESVEDMAEQVAANAERIDALAEAQEGIDLADLASKVDAIDDKADAKTVTELAETVETISENLQDQTSLAAAGGVETNGSEAEDRGVFVDFGTKEVNREY